MQKRRVEVSKCAGMVAKGFDRPAGYQHKGGDSRTASRSPEGNTSGLLRNPTKTLVRRTVKFDVEKGGRRELGRRKVLC
eukprot:759317-Hanusia_phi.AAC.2